MPDRNTAPAANRDWPLVALCCAAYFTSYVTRKGYDASIIAICDATGLARTAAGLASTAAVVVYGSGQFATGVMADRLDPRKIVFAALLLTAGCNAAMPFAAGAACVPAMVALWAANGFAQAMFWPPLVKIVADSLPPERYKSAIFWISVACNAATVAVFLVVAGCVRFAEWRLSFAVVTAMAAATAALWAAAIPRLAPARPRDPRPAAGAAAPDPAETHRTRIPLFRLLLVSGMVPAMAAIACQGVMRDGIEVWAAGIIKDQYGLGTPGSIFSVALLPFFAVGSMVAARALRRALGDELAASFALFATGFCCASFLFAANGSSLAFGLPVLALLSSTMHGSNLMLVGELPGRFAGHGRVGTVSGLLNAFTYVGAAASIYGFAAVHERFSGWRPVFALWMAVLATGMALLAAACRKWRKFAADDLRGTAAERKDGPAS